MPTAPPQPPLPGSDPLVALADRCVQCGLCLPACPTYARDRIEAESPRGRIALARGLARGTVPPTAATDRHLDQCLGCRSCEAVCPAGVEYGALLVAARAAQRTRRRPGLRQRIAEALVVRPALLAAGLGLYRTVFPLLPQALRPLPRPPGRSTDAPASASRPPSAGAERVALFAGCVARAYEPPVHDALRRLCQALGVDVVQPDGQGCCGSLHAHAGDAGTAAQLAGRNAVAFAGQSTVLTLASGCHEAVADAMPAGTTTTDALTWLARNADSLCFRPLHARLGLHLPCTQRNTSRSADATRALLARVPGLELVELDASGCCGAAGTAMLTAPERARGFRTPLLEQAVASAVSGILSANIGCRLHLARGTRLPVRHPLELLAAQLDTQGNSPGAGGRRR